MNDKRVREHDNACAGKVDRLGLIYLLSDAYCCTHSLGSFTFKLDVFTSFSPYLPTSPVAVYGPFAKVLVLILTFMMSQQKRFIGEKLEKKVVQRVKLDGET